MSRQNNASSPFLRAVCERRFTRFRKAFTSDLTFTAKYSDDFGEDDDDSGRRTDDLSSDGPNENEVSETGMRQGGVLGSKGSRSVVCEGCAIMT
jgi:hypothetical protein